jgi:hypothetical protein
MTWRYKLGLNDDIIWYLEQIIINDLMKRKCNSYIAKYHKFAFDEMYKKEGTEMIKYFILHHPLILPTSFVVNDIAKIGDLIKFQFLYDNYKIFTPAYPGQLISNDSPETIVYNNALREAIIHAQLDIIKFLFENLKIVNHRMIMEHTFCVYLDDAVSRRSKCNLEIVKYIYNATPFITHTSVYNACIYGYLEIIKFFFEKNSNRTLFTNHTVNLASASNHLDLLKFLVESCKIKITKKTISCAARKGHLAIVEYLINRIKNDPKMKPKLLYFIDKAIQISEKEGYLTVSQYLNTFL